MVSFIALKIFGVTVLLFVSKTSGNPNILVNFFNIDDDLSEDFEVQRIEKWHQLILNALPKESKIKLAS